jgi:hypothetical protein
VTQGHDVDTSPVGIQTTVREEVVDAGIDALKFEAGLLDTDPVVQPTHNPEKPPAV